MQGLVRGGPKRHSPFARVKICFVRLEQTFRLGGANLILCYSMLLLMKHDVAALSIVADK